MTKEERERVIREEVLEGNLDKRIDMTREEAIARIQEHMIAHKMEEPRSVLISVALNMAIEALSKEIILDKIVAEIWDRCHEDIRDNLTNICFTGKEVLNIIDKYRKVEK